MEEEYWYSLQLLSWDVAALRGGVSKIVSGRPLGSCLLSGNVLPFDEAARRVGVSPATLLSATSRRARYVEG
jgi:hypothetical protein